MARHDLECKTCNAEFEGADTNSSCPKCGSNDTIWLPKAMFYKFTPFWHPHLGHEPVYIPSVEALDRELDALGVAVPSPKKRDPQRRLPETREEALDAW